MESYIQICGACGLPFLYGRRPRTHKGQRRKLNLTGAYHIRTCEKAREAGRKAKESRLSESKLLSKAARLLEARLFEQPT